MTDELTDQEAMNYFNQSVGILLELKPEYKEDIHKMATYINKKLGWNK